MKKFIETIKNIWKIEDLRNRLLITLLFVLIYRFGSFIVLPGIDPTALTALRAQTEGGLMALLDMFSGGAFSNASIFALGIMPYISASIIIQLLTIAVPRFQKMQQEGESGRQKMNQITRVLTVAILVLQGPSYLVNLSVQMAQAGTPLTIGLNWFTISSTIILCAGSMFVMWLGERITDRGVGNGISFIILIGIIARFPGAIVQEFSSRLNEGGGLVVFLAEIVLLLLVFAAAIMLVQGTRRIPVQYAKRMVGNKQYGGVRQYIPLKVNAANVMPIIFAQAIMFIPIMIAGFTTDGSGAFVRAFSDNNGFWYNLVFFLLILAFTYFYTAIIINPQQMAESLKQNNGFIPGVKPGKKTAEFIDTVMSRITLPGSIFLGLIAILPAFARLFGVSMSFAQFFGGTSLLIMVGVILDTLQQIEGHLLMRHYDGFFEDGFRIKGRSGAMGILINLSRRMIFLKTDEEIELMRESNKLLGMAYGEIAKAIAPGVSTAQLDKLAEEFIRDHGGIPSCKGYEGYPATLCTSVNEQVVHGIPSDKVVLKEGDIISVDCVVGLNGYQADSAYTFPVGEIDSETMRLLKTTRECLNLGVAQAIAGKRIGDIGFAVQQHAEVAGFSVVREFVGHGIGRDMHEEPEVPNYGRRGNGVVLKNGMVLAIEPMICLGRRNLILEADEWTARTVDRKPAAHYEYSVAVRNGKADVLSTFDYIKEVLGDKFI